MTDVSALLLGLLMLASFTMCVGAFRVMRRQRLSGDTWRDSEAYRLSVAICIHGLSAIPAFLATLIAEDRPQMSTALVLMWATWGGWLVSKSVIIQITGLLRLALVLYGMWALVWFIWRFSV